MPDPDDTAEHPLSESTLAAIFSGCNTVINGQPCALGPEHEGDHLDAAAVLRGTRYVIAEARDALVQALTSMPTCKCGALASHECYDATSDSFMACAACAKARGPGGMDGDEEPYELPSIPLLLKTLKLIESIKVAP